MWKKKEDREQKDKKIVFIARIIEEKVYWEDFMKGLLKN